MSIADMINEVGIAALEKTSGIPYSTLYRWAKNDALPGKRQWLHDARLKTLKAAIAEIKSAKRKRKVA